MKEGKRTYRYGILVGILAVVMMFSMTACGSSSKETSAIKETISNFETGCKNLDADEILNCLDPTVADPIRTGKNFLNFIGIDMDEMVASAASAVFGQQYADSEFLQSLNIEVKDVEVEDSNSGATVSGTISYTWEGETRSEDVDIDMIHSGDDEEAGWYIEDIRFK